MRTITHTLAGDGLFIFIPETRNDLEGFEEFLSRGDKLLGVDTETTGLDVYSPGHALRLCQFGNEREAWVLRTDLFGDACARALRQPRMFVAHNWSYDGQVVDRHLGVRIEEMADRVLDTRILGHLLDPRDQSEGGTGLGLKALSAIYVDRDAPDTSEDLTAVFRSLGLTKATGWAGIPIDHPTYELYAGLDPILTLRLFREIGPLVRDLGLDNLSNFEHRLQALLAIMQRKGMLVDVAYVERLKAQLAEETERFAAIAAQYGVTNANSTRQVAEALTAMGETLDETTPSGLVKVDKGALLPLADMDLQWERLELREPNPLADAILRSKRADKWSTAYAQAFLDLKDSDDRLHPWIGGLQARTARMSISRPPLQQLPAGDWTIRRALVADPGNVIFSVDFKAVELRVLAALADVSLMKTAISEGRDLHDYTAELMYGPGFTKQHRKIAKATGLAAVYGGGAATISRQTGAPIGSVKEALAAYARVYPEVRRYANRLQSRAEYGRREVVTITGRHLPLDRDRTYAATNYSCQSVSRDLAAQAIVDLFDKGLGEYCILPIHDEILGQAPRNEAAEIAEEIRRTMTTSLEGVPIDADAEVGGRSWGSLYGAPE